MDSWLMAEVLALAGGDDVHDARGVLTCYQAACYRCEWPEPAITAEVREGHRLRAAVFERILRRYRAHRVVGERVRMRDVQRAVYEELLADEPAQTRPEPGVLPCKVL